MKRPLKKVFNVFVAFFAVIGVCATAVYVFVYAREYIEGIESSEDNMRNGTYAFTSNYFAVIKEHDKGNTGGKFQRWMLSDEGQECIRQAGYYPLREIGQ